MKWWASNCRWLCFFIIGFIYVSYASAKELTVLQERARELRSKGYAGQSRGDIDIAMSLYQQALTLDPSYSILYNDIGIIYEAKGQCDQAIEYYLECVKNDSQCISAYSNLALIYEEKGNYRESARYWQKRVDLGDESDPWTKKAKQHLDNVNVQLKVLAVDKEGETSVSEAVTSSGDSIIDKFLSQQGIAVKDDAVTQVSEALVGEVEVSTKKVDYSVLNLDKVLDKFQGDINAAQQENVVSAQRQEVDESYQSLSQQDQCINDKMEMFAEFSSEIGEENRELKSKLSAFTEALTDEKTKNKKEKSALYEQLAAVYVKSKLYNEAIDAYKQSLALGASAPQIYYYLGLLYQYQRKDSKIAVECFREYLELDPYGKYNEKARDIMRVLQ
ncbi:MAG: tetratricopeptide repeat protein [Candidatus Omnitrophota bacterium]|nr:tetratricopeptide repeat protein [Candidatus Omnitrophota bacterium]